MALDEITGVAMTEGQGGWSFDTQLFLTHSSGVMCGTGWSGPQADARKLGERLAGWLATLNRSEGTF